MTWSKYDCLLVGENVLKEKRRGSSGSRPPEKGSKDLYRAFWGEYWDKCLELNSST